MFRVSKKLIIALISLGVIVAIAITHSSYTEEVSTAFQHKKGFRLVNPKRQEQNEDLPIEASTIVSEKSSLGSFSSIGENPITNIATYDSSQATNESLLISDPKTKIEESTNVSAGNSSESFISIGENTLTNITKDDSPQEENENLSTSEPTTTIEVSTNVVEENPNEYYPSIGEKTVANITKADTLNTSSNTVEDDFSDENSKTNNLENANTTIDTKVFDFNGTNINITSDIADLVVYNRVPKCGSTTFLNILKRLSNKNHFQYIHSKIFDKRFLIEEKQKDLLNEIDRKSAHASFALFDRHVFFINFTYFGHEKPNYINLVRHPVDRAISSFYYSRSEMHLKNLKKRGKYDQSQVDKRNFSIETWMISKLINSDKVPDGNDNGIVPYFCGHEIFCRSLKNKDAIQLAKDNILRHFSVVGILEELETSLEVFENFLPRVFNGVTKLYERLYGRHRTVLRKNEHSPVSEIVREALHQHLRLEIELYDFIKQRLKMQWDHINKSSKN